MVKFSDFTESYKINKLLKDKAHTTKECKEKLNEMTTLVSTYVLTILSETCKDKEIDETEIKKVFKSLSSL
jgi:hypothetical protein